MAAALKALGGGNAPKCPRCGDRVYHSEEQLGAGMSWHQKCFSCKECKKGLSSVTLAEKSGEIYCTSCYGKKFGPKGYGYAGGAAGLLSGEAKAVDASGGSAPIGSSGGGRFCSNCGTGGQTGKFCSSCGKDTAGGGGGSAVDSAPAPSVSKAASSYRGGGGGGAVSVGGGDKCGKCGKSVYAAEKVTGAGRSFHDTCFTCTSCRKGLSSVTLAEKDGTLYCTACYAKNFGPKGYGYSGGASSVFAHTT